MATDWDRHYDTGDGVTFDGLTGIISGAADPLSVDISEGGTTIPESAIYIQHGGATPQVFVKRGAGLLDWKNITPLFTSGLEDFDGVTFIDDDTIKFEASSGKFIKVAGVPTPPAGTSSIFQILDGTVDAISGTSVIPLDTSIPLISEGTEVWERVITPLDENSKIQISISFTISVSKNNLQLVFALFEDNVCLGSFVESVVEKDFGQTVSYSFLFPSPGLSEVTYSLRLGKSLAAGGGTWFLNSISNVANALGDTLESSGYTIFELAVVA